MTTEDFKEFVKTGQALDSEDIHTYMDQMSNQARRITFLINTAYRTPEEIRGLLSELFGYKECTPLEWRDSGETADMYHCN